MRSVPNPEVALSAGAVWFPQDADCLELSGSEALDFLNRMSTAELAHLPPGQSRATVFVTEKGRIKDVALVFRRDESTLELFCSPDAGAVLRQWLRRFIFLEDVRIAEPQRWYGAEVHGACAAAVLRDIGLEPPATCSWGTGVGTEWQGQTVRCACVPPFGEGAAYWLLTPHRGLLQEVLSRVAGEPLEAEQREALRLIAGRGRWGHEWSEEYNPWEAGLNELISTTKGCYIGQEVIARLETYGKVQRQLIRLWSAEPLPEPPLPLFAADQRVGSITSVAAVPWRRRWIALGYVRREWLQTSTFWTERNGSRIQLTAVGDTPHGGGAL